MSPFSRRYFMTAGVPPIFCTSSITYLPLGLRSAMNGTRSLHFYTRTKKPIIRERGLGRQICGNGRQDTASEAGAWSAWT